MTGRPSSLTPEVQETICARISDGALFEHAARLAGVTPRTFYGWMKKGRENQDDQDSPYARFFQAVKAASASWVSRLVATIEESAKGYKYTKTKKTTFPDGRVEESVEEAWKKDWQAGAWLLERRHWKQFSRHTVSTEEKPVAADDVVFVARRGPGGAAAGPVVPADPIPSAGGEHDHPPAE